MLFAERFGGSVMDEETVALQALLAQFKAMAVQQAIEREMVQLLFATLAANRIDVTGPLEAARSLAAEQTEGNFGDPAQKAAYLARLGELIRASGRKPN
jgi:hypothetical protein